MENNISQSEDKLALEVLELEIAELEVHIDWLENDISIEKIRLNKLLESKKSMENYLNSDND